MKLIRYIVSVEFLKRSSSALNNDFLTNILKNALPSELCTEKPHHSIEDEVNKFLVSCCLKMLKEGQKKVLQVQFIGSGF